MKEKVEKNFEKLLKRLDDLNLPKDQYAITAGGTLAVRGIRNTSDIDIIVTKGLWEKLAEKYDVEKGPPKKIRLADGFVEVLGDTCVYALDIIKPVAAQIQGAEEINGHRYVRIDIVKKCKRMLARDKDIEDLRLIEAYIYKNSQK